MKPRRKRVLRLRPGHLANFSGGSGYMPFVTIYSVPASLLCAVLSFFLLSSAGRKLSKGGSPEDTGKPRTDLSGFMNYAVLHLLICLVITALAVLFMYPFAVGLIYDMAPGLETAAFFLSVGPFLALLLSSVVLVVLTWQLGFRPQNLMIAALIYLIVLVVTILPEGGFMALLLLPYWLLDYVRQALS